MHEAELTALEQVAADAFIASFSPGQDFVPGQVIGIRPVGGGDHRLYSLCGPAGRGDMQVLFNVVQGGFLTPPLAQARAGSRWLLSDPTGSFRDPGPGGWWIAAGTGVAPFLSMAETGFEGERVLLHGSRTQEHLYRREALEGRPNLRYLGAVSRETVAGPGLYGGRLTEYLRETPIDLSAGYALCGSSEFVVDVRDILIARGVAFERINSEIYF